MATTQPSPAVLALVAALLAPLGTAVSAEEAAPDAHALYETNCLKCHGPEVYLRPDRKVTSYDALGRQVRRCETALGLRWFDEEIADVTAYLNEKFYKLETE
jgi:mono/diheme cytochrome c family protein